MEFDYKEREISYPNKELTLLDKLVLKFLEAVDFRYVIISGYIAILFGRSRNTEDVDIFIEKIPAEGFDKFCRKLDRLGFYLIDAEDSTDAYDRLIRGLSVRFAEKETIEPNFELKFPKKSIDNYSMDNPIKVLINKKYGVMISPIELQITYKLYLGSEKDELDARHLYGIFKENIDRKELKDLMDNLNVKRRYAEEVLGEKID